MTTLFYFPTAERLLEQYRSGVLEQVLTLSHRAKGTNTREDAEYNKALTRLKEVSAELRLLRRL